MERIIQGARGWKWSGYTESRHNYSLKSCSYQMEKRNPQTVRFVIGMAAVIDVQCSQDNARHDNAVANPSPMPPPFFSTRLCSATIAAAHPS